MDFATRVKLKLYEMIARDAKMPNSGAVAKELGETRQEIEAAFRRLSEQRLLVLEPGSQSEIRMAPPFSGIETPFLVAVGEKSYYANCVWDAFGVAAALQQDAVIHAADGYTKEPIELQVKDGKPVPQQFVAHFAVPAAKWWQDIIYT